MVFMQTLAQRACNAMGSSDHLSWPRPFANLSSWLKDCLTILTNGAVLMSKTKGSAKSADLDWEPFGTALFDDPAARSLSRVGVLDIGSNSVRFVVFDGAARSPAYFYNEKIMCALGAGLAQTGRLNPDGRARAVAALRRFQGIAKHLNIARLSAVATAAVRDADDGRDFQAQVKRETGLDFKIIDGNEEARLTAQGVLLGWPEADGLVCDMGGSSMELAVVRDAQVGARISSRLGPLKLMALAPEVRKAEIISALDDMAQTVGPRHARLFLVGGSWRAIARIDMLRRNYPLHVLHEYRISRANIHATADFIANNDLEDLRRACGISSARIGLVPFAIEVLVQLIRRFGPDEIAISGFGIREGLLYEEMPPRLRGRDPLVEACRFAEAKDARLPGFGKVLTKFVAPLFDPMPITQLRLVKAACLLHDVNWRAHPDYRAETCFDTVTRANLSGLDHEERVFLGIALLHRYRNKRDDTPFAPLYDLISPDRQLQAEVLGKAMRIGAMLCVSDKLRPGELSLDRAAKQLTLTLSDEARPLYGEVAEARMASLAKSLGVTHQVLNQL